MSSHEPGFDKLLKKIEARNDKYLSHLNRSNVVHDLIITITDPGPQTNQDYHYEKIKNKKTCVQLIKNEIKQFHEPTLPTTPERTIQKIVTHLVTYQGSLNDTRGKSSLRSFGNFFTKGPENAGKSDGELYFTDMKNLLTQLQKIYRDIDLSALEKNQEQISTPEV